MALDALAIGFVGDGAWLQARSSGHSAIGVAGYIHLGAARLPGAHLEAELEALRLLERKQLRARARNFVHLQLLLVESDAIRRCIFVATHCLLSVNGWAQVRVKDIAVGENVEVGSPSGRRTVRGGEGQRRRR
jgi:hypothetical protein